MSVLEGSRESPKGSPFQHLEKSTVLRHLSVLEAL